MKFRILFTALAIFPGEIYAVGVSGAAEGFAKGVTGGGSATAVYPSTTAELVSYLGDSTARVIVLTKTYVYQAFNLFLAKIDICSYLLALTFAVSKVQRLRLAVRHGALDLHAS